MDATASWLKEKGINALPYHAGLSAEIRHKHQHQFLMEEGLVIVATIAFGMGIDKPNVRFVAHLDLPKSIEAYYQETGRAGRDGLAADAWMVYGLQDVVTLRQMLATSNADEAHKRLEYHKLDAMLALCETVSCRRQSLLSYFGDTLKQPCGNCDTCQLPVKTWDGTIAAQQALSCIYRTGQRFGSSYLIDVLLGKSNEKMIGFGHDKQSTFGIGRDLDEKQWRSVFRQLVAKGLVEIDFEGYGAFKLTEACRSVLRGECTVMLRKDIQTEKGGRSKREKRHLSNHEDNLIWNALRAKRRQIADDQDVPPYVIFHDATLMEMVESKPENHREMSQISGVGERKLALYADPFLAVIKAFNDDREDNLISTITETVALFRLGYTVKQVAQQRTLSVDTIYNHLAHALEQGDVVLTDVVDLSAQEIQLIEDVIVALPTVQKNSLKPVVEHFDGIYNLGVLRCIRANLQRKTKAQ